LAAILLDRYPGAADELVPRLASGEAHAGVATEEGTLTARRDEAGGLVIDGDAGLVLGADEDAVLLLPVAYDDTLRWFVVGPGTPGVEVEPSTPLDASQALARVRLNAAVVPPAALIVGLDDAVVRDMAVTLAAAEASGVAAWCLRTASEYAAVREQFGQKIGAFQAVKHLCAHALCRAEQAGALAWDAARAADDSADQHTFASAIAGAAALDAAVANAKDCIQVLGG
ncbi:MAG: acyl-CoA dehydrogenase, partial [Actinophytocola sp.]|nr:acyl-CoA dehydrogenase [Actinophytocola sp.]